MWDVEVPADRIDVEVDDGWITLKGNVEYEFQRDVAFDDVAGLYGVYGVTDEIVVNTL
jgi:osmotically-inducible protein OsmY